MNTEWNGTKSSKIKVKCYALWIFWYRQLMQATEFIWIAENEVNENEPND